VGCFLAREKTSQTFRDAVHDQYKSSNSSKKKRRQVAQALKFLRSHSVSDLCFSGTAKSLNAYSQVGQKSFNTKAASFDDSFFLLDDRSKVAGRSVFSGLPTPNLSTILRPNVGADPALYHVEPSTHNALWGTNATAFTGQYAPSSRSAQNPFMKYI
jgi:hypothetical protein